MRPASLILCALTFSHFGAANETGSAAGICAALHDISIDPNESYYVRDLQLSRGGVKFYLTEGILSFATPVEGRRVAAVFTTAEVEAGDAEVIVMPPRRSERASLAAFTKSPNLDEHFQSATFLFSDDTAREIMAQINDRPVRRAADFALRAKSAADPIIRDVTARLDIRLVRALLDRHPIDQGFFFSLIGAPNLGNFAVLYEPTAFEPVTIGRPGVESPEERFKLWASFRPRSAPPYNLPPPRIHSYHIETGILADLSMDVNARFDMDGSPEDGRILPFALSDRLAVDSASVDGKPAEIMQRGGFGPEGLAAGSFLIITPEPLTPGTAHQVTVHYHGSLIRRVDSGAYFVDQRNAWYPQNGTTLANFDLLFRFPANLRLVSTGEPVSEAEDGSVRVVHRRTSVPELMAGFNLGAYDLDSVENGGYHVECYSISSSPSGLKTIAAQTSQILEFYSRLWGTLPIHSIAVSPIPGYFGQGFPGLIYLSTVSYMRQEDRPAKLRSSQMDTFFSELLLPHEVAHQWWGNAIAPADYRSAWLVEAMANDSALQYLLKQEGPEAVNQVLERYRQDLLDLRNGRTVESAGPVDFGLRLMENEDTFVWHTVIYEKGTWILHMLRERLGNEAFRKMQVQMLREFASKPITNEDFRLLASRFVPPDSPDRDLSVFFDTWVYGTGVPTLRLTRGAHATTLNLTGTDEDFTVDIPLRCQLAGRPQRRVVRAVFGSQVLGESAKVSTCELPGPFDFLYSASDEK